VISERYGKLVGDAINNCLTKRECELNALIALQQFTSRSVGMLLFACCNGDNFYSISVQYFTSWYMFAQTAGTDFKLMDPCILIQC